jgi:hypothetical protein
VDCFEASDCFKEPDCFKESICFGFMLEEPDSFKESSFFGFELADLDWFEDPSWFGFELEEESGFFLLEVGLFRLRPSLDLCRDDGNVLFVRNVNRDMSNLREPETFEIIVVAVCTTTERATFANLTLANERGNCVAVVVTSYAFLPTFPLHEGSKRRLKAGS